MDRPLILAVTVVVEVVKFLSGILHYLYIIISYCALQDMIPEYW